MKTFLENLYNVIWGYLLILASYQGLCLAVMTGPFVLQVFRIKAIQFETLSLQFSNVGDLEEATTFPF